MKFSMEMMDEVISKLRDKDNKAAYEYAKQLGVESAESDKYLDLIPQFAKLLTDENSYVRTRGFCLICNQARWADAGQIESVFDEMSALLYDAKPTVVRMCLGALHEVALYRPEMADRIIRTVHRIDITKYKDSMSGLIEKDMKELLKIL